MQLEAEIKEKKSRKSPLRRFTLGAWRGVEIGGRDRWEAEPDMDRVVDGVASEMVPRNKAIGNGQVPLVAAYAFRVLETLDR